MHIHILGIGGTFMGGLAALARAAGITVSGQDQQLYPPMSTQLDKLGIQVSKYSPDALPQSGTVDMIVVGNVMSRGMHVIEAMLNRNLPYTSGPQWLAENVLRDKWVLAVSGTHGKTSTASILAWALEYNGYHPGFLIGGVPKNFNQSARLTDSQFFVVEADEYDSAFFDKRSKFVHYHPSTLVINNLEFDHADIFSDLSDIQKQFHHLIRTVPGNGMIVYNHEDSNINPVLEMGSWSKLQSFGTRKNDMRSDWSVEQHSAKKFLVKHKNETLGTVNWQQIGQHNVQNALAAIAAAHHIGIGVEHACNALGSFQGVKRRLEILFAGKNASLYDDFAHHPTAIRLTLEGLRAMYPDDRIIAVFDPHSNTMKKGEHIQVLSKAFDPADQIWAYQHPDLEWTITDVFEARKDITSTFTNVADAASDILSAIDSEQHSHIVVLSNGSFSGMRQILLENIST